LFRFWVSRPEELPQSYQEQLAEEKPERVVCDYIAGMTDSFVLREYEREKTNIHSAVSTQPRS